MTSPISTSHPLPRPPADTAPPPVPAVLWHQAAAEAPVGPAGSELPSGEALLVVAAHPDDEAIGAGRLLADHDGPVRCLTLTAGERCHGSGTDTGQVARTRLREWREALAVLGATPLETPRWPDGRLADHEQEAAEALTVLAAEAGAVLAPWRHDPHPDHEAAGRIAAAAARRAGVPCWSYLVWTPYWLSPADVAARGAAVVGHPTSERAERLWREALACHRSQVAARPPARRPVVPAELLDRHVRQFLVRESDDPHA